MIDKARVIQQLPQLYGTQYKIDKDGIVKYIEIEKYEDLEKRRAEYDMESFGEFNFCHGIYGLCNIPNITFFEGDVIFALEGMSFSLWYYIGSAMVSDQSENDILM